MRAGWPSHYCHYCLSCCILKVDSQVCFTGHTPASGAYCRILHHNQSKAGLAFLEALFFVLHLSPVLPMGGSQLGLKKRVQHINLSCAAESPFPCNLLPYLIPPPQPCQSQEAGHTSRSARHAGPVNTSQHQEQQVLSLPIINYPRCITPGPLSP